MNLDWNTLAPAVPSFVGVLVGWGLKEFSDLFRGSRDAVRNRKAGLYQLIRLHHEMTRIERILDLVKDASADWSMFETFRARYAERYGDKTDEFISALKSTIRRVAETDPWSAIELQHVLETFVSLGGMKLTPLLRAGTDSYLKGLSTIEANYFMGIKALRVLIHSEARRCGIPTWFRTLWSFHRFDGLSKSEDPTGLTEELKTLFDSIQKRRTNVEPDGSPNSTTTQPANSTGTGGHHR